jgi:hypothetical protein
MIKEADISAPKKAVRCFPELPWLDYYPVDSRSSKTYTEEGSVKTCLQNIELEMCFDTSSSFIIGNIFLK